MIRISQIKLRPDHSPWQLEKAVLKKLNIKSSDLKEMRVIRQSVDARKKPDIFYVYTVDVNVKGESALLKRFARDPQISTANEVQWQLPACKNPGAHPLSKRPVIIGSGPAGLFCALVLSRAGFKPIVVERGEAMEERTGTVEHFWNGGPLNPNSNVQFGEGGAGTFSDGKLNTSIKDSSGRIRFVLKTFVEAGADPDILYSYKPHIGTDVLRRVVTNIREEIIANGGSFLFSHVAEDITEEFVSPLSAEQERLPQDSALSALSENASASSPMHLPPERLQTLQVRDLKTNEVMQLQTQIVIAALGHSARDTFRMLYNKGYKMTPKAFAVGVRVQHPQKLIDDAMYGEACPYDMPASPYKLTCKLENGGGVYSFCMCPGGYVVNASSEEGRLAVNGMSYHGRSSGNANSAIVVTVSPEQYIELSFAHGSEHCDASGQDSHVSDIHGPGGVVSGDHDPGTQIPRALQGIAFQQHLEERAYRAGGGKIPTQTLADFLDHRKSTAFGNIQPVTKGACAPADVRSIFPDFISDSIEEGMKHFERIIPGFASPDVLLSAVESRTSSPVRIERTEDMNCEDHPGFYPCGEGAGYAGGITSAAVDGLRVAEAIASKFSIDFPLV